MTYHRQASSTVISIEYRKGNRSEKVHRRYEGLRSTFIACKQETVLAYPFSLYSHIEQTLSKSFPSNPCVSRASMNSNPLLPSSHLSYETSRIAVGSSQLPCKPPELEFSTSGLLSLFGCRSLCLVQGGVAQFLLSVDDWSSEGSAACCLEPLRLFHQEE